MGGTTMLRWATTFDAVDGGWADRMAQLPGGNPVRKEAWDETDWRSTRSFVALDIDVAHAMKAVLLIREAMVSDQQGGQPARHGVVLALLVAEDFAANKTKAALVTKPGMAQTAVLMKMPIAPVAATAGWGWLFTPGCALLADDECVLWPPRVVGGVDTRSVAAEGSVAGRPRGCSAAAAGAGYDDARRWRRCSAANGAALHGGHGPPADLTGGVP
jgi:hypothetical protein